MSIKVTWGNHKLGSDTLIFNMGPAKTCPSKTLGLCPIYNSTLSVRARCYAEAAEIQYKDRCVKSRERIMFENRFYSN